MATKVQERRRAKSATVEIDLEIHRAAKAVAAAQDMTLSEYLNSKLLGPVMKDLGTAGQHMQRRAEAAAD